jgi:hypothetical protein
MALASFRTLNSPGPTVSISFAASAAIPDLVRPARVPGFRFGFDVLFFRYPNDGHEDSPEGEESGASYRNHEMTALSE